MYLVQWVNLFLVLCESSVAEDFEQSLTTLNDNFLLFLLLLGLLEPKNIACYLRLYFSLIATGPSNWSIEP